ncbi:hypothetical protein BTN92_04605 [Enterococcus mundtii]|uniref:Uncharacterized protein n=1 Tax=Enterococcus mundtii TaxID=53346 RepID=A0A1V2UL12_ENTMU|nr:hypothetical protein BTN92_04605 [Enterococcus mundtii]
MRLGKVMHFLFSNLMWSNDPRINDQYLRRSGQQRVISINKASSTKMVLQLFVDDALFLAEFFFAVYMGWTNGQTFFTFLSFKQYIFYV